jgi:hypothetical protein
MEEFEAELLEEQLDIFDVRTSTIGVSPQDTDSQAAASAMASVHAVMLQSSPDLVGRDDGVVIYKSKDYEERLQAIQETVNTALAGETPEKRTQASWLQKHELTHMNIALLLYVTLHR